MCTADHQPYTCTYVRSVINLCKYVMRITKYMHVQSGGALFWQADKVINIHCDPALGGHSGALELYESDYVLAPQDYINDYVQV